MKRLVERIKEWWNAPSWEEETSQRFNDALAYAKGERLQIQEDAARKYKEIDNMTSKQLLKFIAKEIYKLNIREELGVVIR